MVCGFLRLKGELQGNEDCSTATSVLCVAHMMFLANDYPLLRVAKLTLIQTVTIMSYEYLHNSATL